MGDIGCSGVYARIVFADNLVTAVTKLFGKQRLKRPSAIPETAVLIGGFLLGEKRPKGNKLEMALGRVETLLFKMADE